MPLTSDFYSTRLPYMQREQANQKEFRHRKEEAIVRDVPMIDLSRIVYFVRRKQGLL